MRAAFARMIVAPLALVAGSAFAQAEEPAASEVAPPASTLVLSDDELADLGLDVRAPATAPGVQLSGFADVGFGSVLGDPDHFLRGAGVVPTRSTFYVGNFNVYLLKQLSQSVSTMGEVRLTFLPNGSTGFGTETRVDTTTSDYADYGRSTRWGGIILQRIYAEWAAHPLLNVRGGLFLSPYGVWNVDHGSPVYIPVRRPWSIGVGWIPERQTGIEIFGRTALDATSTVGYHLTVSNGAGPVSEYADLDENKAIGGRLYWEYRRLGTLRLGLSSYYGRETNARFQPQLTSNGKVKGRETIEAQFDALTLASDLTWNLGGLHAQTEWLVHQRSYTRRGRTSMPAQLGGTYLPSDVFSWGGYVLLGYRFPWLGIMPFVVGERVVSVLMDVDVDVYALELGLNVRPIDALVLKLSYSRVHTGALVDEVNLLMSQVAWSF